MGLITTSLITILYHDNIDEKGSSHRVALQQPPQPTRVTIQKRKLPSPTLYNIDRGPYAPPGYDPEVLDSTHFKSLCQPQKSAEEMRLATPIVQWERDMYTSIPDARLEQGQKIRYKPPSLFHSTPRSDYMMDQSNSSTMMSNYQPKQPRSSWDSDLNGSLNRPLVGTQLYAPRMESPPYSFTQPSDHPYGHRQHPYTPPPNTPPQRNRRDTMWGEPGVYPSYVPFDRVISYP